jgi:hypothetical protein
VSSNLNSMSFSMEIARLASMVLLRGKDE